MAKTAFHDYADSRFLQTSESAAWVLARRNRRTVRFGVANHYHPFTDALVEKLNRDGLPALLDATWQGSLATPLAPAVYQPTAYATGDFPVHEIDVADAGAYAIYNWELFFHAPVLIATHLSKNQRFEEAQRWFHYVFDPTNDEPTVPAPQRFWRFLRFREETTPDRIGDLLVALSKGTDAELVNRMLDAIQAWRDHPFQPHVVARSRVFAYQMNVVMKYLDNLLAWGDFLFRQDTVETMNEATQIYVLAAGLLGPRPQEVPARRTPPKRTYAQLKAGGLDPFANALVQMENAFPFNESGTGDGGGDPGTGSAFGIGRSLYFCVPDNDLLLGYWDKVGDRLFKLRHCQNIEGVFRIPALFDPPLDPGALVKAAAAGLDIAAIVNNVNQPVSTVRGALLLEKAQQLCAEVKALGKAALRAVEHADAEHLAALRQGHELNVLRLVREVRFLQWKEAEAATDALVRSRGVAFERWRHYKHILGADDGAIEPLRSVELVRNELTEETFDAAFRELVGMYGAALPREDYRKETSVGGLMEFAGNAVVSVVGGELGKTLPLNKNENAELNIFLPSADFFSTIATALKIATPILALIPQFGAAAKPMGVGAEIGFGGIQLSKAAKYGAEGAEKVSDAFKGSADRASKMANYYRRAEDYVAQANQATADLEQYGRQILASLLREQVARHDYEQHLRQIDQAEEAAAFLAGKFTNEELYTWMHGQLGQLHYDAYKLAFDVAKRAEQTLKHEVMRPELDDQQFVSFGYWDAAHRGQLAGETLSVDLKRLELAWLEQNRREYELTEHVSLARLDPVALLRLKATGACEVTVPEWLFDLTAPGQYFRRLKTVSVSLPGVTGLGSAVHAKLSLLRSSIRISSAGGGSYGRAGGDDDRFRDFAGAIESIVTSTGEADSGLFEIDLDDDRRLPFEGAGAVSTWRIELPVDVPLFDPETLADVVLHLRFTSREAGNLRPDAVAFVKDEVLSAPDTLVQLFSLNADFASAWGPFAAAADNTHPTLAVSLTKDAFPYWVKPLGIDDRITASFAVVDASKHKLAVAPAKLDFAGDATAGWTLTIDSNSPVYPFLRKYKKGVVHMAVTYKEA